MVDLARLELFIYYYCECCEGVAIIIRACMASTDAPGLCYISFIVDKFPEAAGILTFPRGSVCYVVR